MRQTQIENMLKDHERRIKIIEETLKEDIDTITDLKQETALIKNGSYPNIGKIEKTLPLPELEEKLETKTIHPDSIVKIDNSPSSTGSIPVSPIKEESGVMVKGGSATVTSSSSEGRKPKSKKTPQENYKQSVASKGLPTTKEEVSTTESGDGESPGDKINLNKSENKDA